MPDLTLGRGGRPDHRQTRSLYKPGEKADVVRVLIGDKLIVDDFYNGEPLEIGLCRHAAELKNGELTIAILPLQKGAPIYLSSPSARPDFAGKESVVRLERAEIVPRRTVELTGQP